MARAAFLPPTVSVIVTLPLGPLEYLEASPKPTPESEAAEPEPPLTSRVASPAPGTAWTKFTFVAAAA